jgi:predicted TIM-barrel fold metal-dependent hydrolase
MRIVALEEHFTGPSLVRRIDAETIARRGFQAGPGRVPDELLADLGAGRVGDMDAAGITMQVLSASGPGADLLDGAEGTAFARDINNILRAAVAEHPDRFAAFAQLPMRSPPVAADELERAVRDLGFCGALINGMTQDRFLDDPRFDPILARAEQLDVPIYLHPSLPPEAVRKAYYDGLPRSAGFLLSAGAWGWHSEVAIHVLRLVLSGALDRHPRLRLIIGHMGEGLPAMLVRADNVLGRDAAHLTRSVRQTILDQVSITTSGLFTLPPFEVALAVFGVDRVMFSIDYPYSSNRQGRDFLDALDLPAADLAKVAHGNADRLLKLADAKTMRHSG